MEGNTVSKSLSNAVGSAVLYLQSAINANSRDIADWKEDCETLLASLKLALDSQPATPPAASAKPLTDAQLIRAGNNAPEPVISGISRAAFNRVFRFAEAVHGIGGQQ